MFSALLVIMVLSVTDLGKLKGLAFRPLSKMVFGVFVANFLLLMVLGGKHVEDPFVFWGQISTALYFSYFIVIVPIFSILENLLIGLGTTFSRKHI